MVRPKSIHNSLSDITTHKRWSTVEDALFEMLYIEGNLEEEVYLAAYLACWLCTFVLPGKDVNSIRPSTFKMASMMASGRRVSLVIPVLTSIYEGLNTIATSSRPASSYLKTHYPVWQGLRGSKMTRFSGEGGAKPFKFVDNGDAKELEYNYFVAICSSYLTLCQGDKFIIEPYSPHRFGGQFGYFQDVPGILKYDTRAASLEEGLCYWRLCVLSKCSSKAWLPGLPTNSKKFCSETYKAWWAKVHAVAVEASKGKGPLHNLVDSDSSNKDRHSKRQKKGLTPLKAVEAGASRSPSTDFIQQISNTSVDFLSSIEDDVYLILESMKNFHKFDITKEAKARLQDVQAKASEDASKVQSIMDKLEHVEKEIVVLKGRRTS
ncbi:UNVERIFIED_CONTAM: hypothetical protein Sradi_2044400 [Sesamum radiatum]|uniref:Aminotransferase-like plant mobile domain-containing protein n=1 Tax=Sesamum radiatum TaxID=300843 RepID=A0AAW2TK31_SESRA